MSTHTMADLTVSDLGAVLGLHPETLRRLARTGCLPGVYKVGGRWLMSREAAARLRKLPDIKVRGEVRQTDAGDKSGGSADGMNAREIVMAYLIEHGFDGLYLPGTTEEDACGCFLDDFMPCDGIHSTCPFGDCKPAHRSRLQSGGWAREATQ